MFLLTLAGFSIRKVSLKSLILSSFPSGSKRQREGRNCHEQNVSTDFRAFDQTDQSVRSGHHPHPQALPHRQPQHPGPVAPVHQPAPVHRPHQTSETGRWITRVQMRLFLKDMSFLKLLKCLQSKLNHRSSGSLCWRILQKTPLSTEYFSPCPSVWRWQESHFSCAEKCTHYQLWMPHLNRLYMNPPEACQLADNCFNLKVIWRFIVVKCSWWNFVLNKKILCKSWRWCLNLDFIWARQKINGAKLIAAVPSSPFWFNCT